MKALLNLVEKIKPTFSKGGKLGFLHSTFDAFETFLFVPNTVTKSGAHIRDCVDLKRVMTVVIVALMPALAFGIWNVGEQHSIAFGLEMSFIEKVWFGFLKVLPLIIVSYVVGLGIEFISAQLRGHEVNEGYLVSGMLIPMIMPVDVPLWILALAVAFAVIIPVLAIGLLFIMRSAHPIFRSVFKKYDNLNSLLKFRFPAYLYL